MKQNIALVLSSGGARGMAHIGVIEELERRGHHIKSIAGSSIGSVIGGAYAAGVLEKYKEWVCSFDKMDVFKLMDFIVSRNGFIRGDKMLMEMKKFFPDSNIEDLSIPLAIIGANITNHEEVIFREGSLYEAMRASISVPSIFTPYMKDGMEIVDGGVINPFPVDVIDRDANDTLVAVNLNYPGKYERPEKFKDQLQEYNGYGKIKEFINEKWSSFFNTHTDKKNKRLGFFDLITQSMWVLQEKVTEMYIQQYQPDVVVNISRYASDTLGFHRSKELIEYGKQEAGKAFDQATKNQPLPKT
ncbi:MAG: patatin-like phospholipase family protein [Bacteroidales bacterium]|nr:patatin-like phospholipase family protein [Bacteroidales bacterium]MCF8338043.1 patatin-like phospholipase family protein [Bacteroidales bacterium]